MRHLFVAATSVVVVASLAAYVLGPPSDGLTVDLRSVHLSAEAHDGSVVYGRVHDGDEGVGGVEVSTGHRSDRTWSDDDGTFRLVVAPGRRTIEFSCECGGHERSSSIELDLRPGRAYELDVSVDDEDGFVVFPVSGY